MTKPDYAFKGPYRYEVESTKYDKHRSYDYLKFRYVKSLLKQLRNIHVLNHRDRRSLWNRVAREKSRPLVRIDVRNYEPPYEIANVNFLVDTGASISLLTAETADSLGIDRRPGPGDSFIVHGIGCSPFVGLKRWIYVFLGGRLHPIPALVPPENNQIGQFRAVPSKSDILGRAAVTSCFLMCFDNKRLYAFARRTSEPGMK
jgi:hypothetical protein